MFSGCTVPPDSKETKPGSSNQEAFSSAGKNTGIVLVPCCAKVSLQLFLVVWIFPRSLAVISYDRWVSSKGYNITAKISVS